MVNRYWYILKGGGKVEEKLILEEIKKHIKSEMNILVLDSVNSTNNLAKELLLKGEKTPFLVAANNQTNGRGRQGKSFFSKENGGIYMTLAIGPDIQNYSLVTAKTAVATAQALRSLKNLPFLIKWVNDIYLFDKKVCGILCEAVREPATNLLKGIIIGIGVNTNIENFPKEISSVAASINICEGEKNLIAAEIINNLYTLLKSNNRDFLDKYREWSYLAGKSITFCEKGISYSADVLSIDQNGGLIVRLKNGETKTLMGGEISALLH